MAEAPRELAHDRDIVACLARWVERLAAALHAPLAARNGSFRFAPARGCRKDDLGQLAGLGEKNVLDDEMLEAAQQGHRMFLIGLRLRRILADDVERLQLAALDRLEHLCEIPSGSSRQLRVPS